MSSNLTRNSTGGRAAAGGGEFERRFGGWLAARMLAEAHAAALWDLRDHVMLQKLWFQAPLPVDDIACLTSEGGRILFQCKSGRISASESQDSPFRDVIRQFAAYFALKPPSADPNGIWLQPPDPDRDRFVLVLDRGASSTITNTLVEILQRIRALGTGAEPDAQQVAFSTADKTAFAMLDRIAKSELTTALGRTPAGDEFLRFYRLLRIQVVAVYDNEVEWREARDLLARHIGGNANTSAAWSTIQTTISGLQSTGGQLDRSAIVKTLEQAGVAVGNTPSYETDITRLRDLTRQTLDRLESHRLLSIDGATIQINRDAVAVLSNSATASRALALVGDAGSGKTGVLASFVIHERGEGRDVVFLSADNLDASSTGQLKVELGLHHDLSDVLANWRGVGFGVLCIDALDAARESGTARMLQQLLRDLQRIDRWHIVVTIRTFDLANGANWRDLFAGTPVGTCKNPKFAHVRHLHLEVLSNEELAQVGDKSSKILKLFDSAGPELTGLLRVPFNLQIAAHLLSDGLASDAFSPFTTQISLLEKFWDARVGTFNDREAAVAELVNCLLEARRMRAVTSYAFRNIARELLANNVLSVDDTTNSIGFQHHILFDYAVARTKLRVSNEDFARFLAQQQDTIIAILPSVRIHYDFLWSQDSERRAFWDAAALVCCSGTRKYIQLIGPTRGVEVAASEHDIQPVLRQVTGVGPPTDTEAGGILVRHIVGALVAAAPDRLAGGSAGPWAFMAAQLAATLSTDDEARQNDVRIMVLLLSEWPDKLTEQQLASTGTASRALLAFAWSLQRASRVLLLQAIRAVCKTYGTAPAESRQLLTHCFDPKILAERDFEVVPVLGWEIDRLIASDPEFAGEVYGRSFDHDLPSSDETTRMGHSQLLVLTSNRRQDFESVLHSLERSFENFLRRDFEQATRAVCRVATAYVRRKERRIAKAERTAQFQFRSAIATIEEDHCYIWDAGETYHEPAREMLQTFEGFLNALARDGDVARLERILDLLVHENLTAAIWRRTLRVGANNSGSFGKLLYEMLLSSFILCIPDTRHEAAKLVAALFPQLPLDRRLSVEHLIGTLPSLHPHLGDHARDTLLASIPVDLLQSPDSIERWRALANANQLRKTTPDFEVGEWSSEPFTTEKWFGEKGIDTSTPDHQNVMAIAGTIETWHSDFQNKTPDSRDVAVLEPLLRNLGDACQASRSLDDDVRQYAVGMAAAAAARAVLAEGLEPEQAELLRRILLDASRSPAPSEDPEQDAQFESSPSWGFPSARIHAAEGLMFLANVRLDDEVVEAVFRLAKDKRAAVRWQIFRLCHLLWKADQGLTWQLAERCTEEECNRGVLLGFVHAPLEWLCGRDLERASTLLFKILEKAVDVALERERDHLPEACHNLIAELYLWRDCRRADAFVREVLDSPLQHQSAAITMTVRIVGYITWRKNDAEVEAARRAWSFCTNLTRSLTNHWNRLRAEPSVGGSRTEEQQGPHVALVHIADDLAVRLQFAAEGHGHGKDGDRALSADALTLFLTNVEPLVRPLAELPNPRIAHELSQMLRALVPADPAKVLLLLADVVRGGVASGLDMEDLASKVISEIVTMYLVSYRDVLGQNEASRTALLDVLDAFVSAGWPDARRLAYRLEEIYR